MGDLSAVLEYVDPTDRVVISQLSDCSIHVLLGICKPDLMKKNSIREETIRKNLPPKHKNIDVHEAMKELNKQGIVKLYRAPDNWTLSKYGIRIGHFLYDYYKEEKMNKFGLSSINKRG